MKFVCANANITNPNNAQIIVWQGSGDVVFRKNVLVSVS